MKNVFLKVKMKSLAAEAQFIRKEERKLNGLDPRRELLYRHRVWHIRKEARATHLARAIISDVSYVVLEAEQDGKPNKVGISLDKNAVVRMVRKHAHPAYRLQDLELWFEGKVHR